MHGLVGDDGGVYNMLCPIILESNTIELSMHTSCYCGLCSVFIQTNCIIFIGKEADAA